jgi:hypothetical protein
MNRASGRPCRRDLHRLRQCGWLQRNLELSFIILSVRDERAVVGECLEAAVLLHLGFDLIRIVMESPNRVLPTIDLRS